MRYIVEHFLERQQDIRFEVMEDAEIRFKWKVSKVNLPLGMITLEHFVDEDEVLGTVLGIEKYGNTTITLSDLPPQLLKLVRDSVAFIDFCIDQDKPIEIDNILINETTAGIKDICSEAYLKFRKHHQQLKDEGAEGPWDVIPDHRSRKMLYLWHPKGKNMMAGQVIDQIYDHPGEQERKDKSAAFNQQLGRWRKKYKDIVVPYKRERKSSS